MQQRLKRKFAELIQATPTCGQATLHGKRWISALLKHESLRAEFVDDLRELIIDYAEPTLCDILQWQLSDAFQLIEPAPIGAKYGDWSAKWKVGNATDTDFESTNGYTRPMHEFYSDFEQELKSQIDANEELLDWDLSLKTCHLIAEQFAEEHTQYFCIYVPSNTFIVFGPNSEFKRFDRSTPLLDAILVDVFLENTG